MKINKYPDGTSYVNIENQNYANITFKVNSYEDLWHLGQLIETANYNGVKPTVTIPNLIDAQADRRFNKYESSGLKLVCKWLNSFDVLKYRIFHPHNTEVVEALLDKVEIINNSIFITRILYRGDYGICSELECTDLELKNNLILMSSDAGGFKPLVNLTKTINWRGETYSAGKHRKYDGNETRLTQFVDRNDFQGKDILIIDDISVYGGTFKGLSKLLRERNCGKLYLAVSHMTVQNLGKDPVTNYFDKIYTTNSKFDKYTYEQQMIPTEDYLNIQPSNLEVIKMF